MTAEEMTSRSGASRAAASTVPPELGVPTGGPVFGRRFAVATDHPLVSLAAMNVLQKGGNAVDATIAASAVNVVTKPQRTHLGGDAFTLIWRKRTGEVDCLNAGGRAPLKANLGLFPDGIPGLGPRASTIPGLVDSWMEMHTRYATLPLDSLLKPAIELAERGFPISTRLSRNMAGLAGRSEPEEEPIRSVFLVDGKRPYAPGETLRQPDLAATLSRIAEEGRDGFYAGKTAELIAKGMAQFGGLIDEADFEKPTAEWTDPLVVNYKGYEIYEQGLPSQGLIVLEALNILENFPLPEWGVASADSVHTMIEAAKLAFADVRRYAADPDVESVPVEQLLSKEHAKRRAAEIEGARTKSHDAANLNADTTCFVVADEETVVAYIQSVYLAWGSHFLIPGTGIVMNNRLRGFHTDPQSPNRLEPGKRTVHTLNTFLALRDGQLVVGGGTPGADYQVQTNIQTLVSVLDWGLDLSAAINTPRWGMTGGSRVSLESRFPNAVKNELVGRGHEVREVSAWEEALCRSQVIGGLADGGWAAASDMRGEGLSLGY